MTDDTVTVDMDNQEEFENAFFNRETPVEKAEPEKDIVDEDDEAPEVEDDHLATDEENDGEDDAEEEDEEEDEESEPEPEPKPKPKNSAKERIEQLVKQNREAERREAALIARLERLEAAKEVEKPTPKLREVLTDDAPSPDALDDDGEPIYQLGEFDPKYIRDLTRYTINVEKEAAKAADAEAENQRMVEAAQEEIKTNWLDRLEKAEEKLPDIREKLETMGDTFADVDPAYGEYLAATIMSCEAGPEIMYYLSQNIGEAQKIVASGPAAATLAIGRLEARLGTTAAPEPKRNTKKVSGAPLPPEQRTRGSGSKFSVSPDTDDLDAFEREFYKKK